MKTTATKTEKKIIDHVRACNDAGALAGFGDKDARFVARLAESGQIVRVEWRRDLGAGWAIAGHPIASK